MKVIPDEIEQAIVVAELKRILRPLEGREDTPYNDHLGNCTVGIGHLLHLGPCTKTELEAKYTDDKIENDFHRDVDTAMLTAKNLFRAVWYKLSIQRKVALSELAFQLGIKRLLGFKAFREALLKEDYLNAVAELLDSKWALKDTPVRAIKVVTRFLRG